MKLTPYGYGLIGLIIFSIWISSRICKRMKTQAGCLTLGYISTVVFCISLFAVGITGISFSYAVKKIDILIHSKSYTAKVIDFETRESTDSDGNDITSYYPILKFTTESGQVIIRISDESDISHDHIVGENRTVYYDEAKDSITTIGAGTFVSIVGISIFQLIFGMLFIGIILYGFGFKMDKYIQICQIIGFKFFLPFIMIVFDALLIYALFYGDTSGSWVVIPLLLFFIVVLTLAIWGYINMTIKKGIPKMRRVSATRWEGDWE